MKPISYSKKDEVTTFHYKYSDLKEFIRLGHLYGDVGMILVKRTNKLTTYKGFGVIENPCKFIQTLSIVPMELFDGKRRTDDEILHPPLRERILESYSIVLLDMRDTKVSNVNIQKI